MSEESKKIKLERMEEAYLQDAITYMVETHVIRVKEAFENEPTPLTDAEGETIGLLIENLEKVFECTFPRQKKKLSAIPRHDGGEGIKKVWGC